MSERVVVLDQVTVAWNVVLMKEGVREFKTKNEQAESKAKPDPSWRQKFILIH